MRGYKGFEDDLTCMGFQYEIGKTYQIDGDPELCIRGFHFCKKITDIHDFYNLQKSRVCEIEAHGKVISDIRKCVCSKITILRELSKEEVYNLTNYGFFNGGVLNTGNYNRGNLNSGQKNQGSWNTGDSNLGYCNTGFNNRGIGNSGYFNAGDRNTGRGNYGSHNSGNFNACDFSSGLFMTRRISYEAFNKTLTESEYSELLNSEGYEILQNFRLTYSSYRPTRGGARIKSLDGYRVSWRIFWNSLTPKEKLAVRRMPHFDDDVFFEITGIRV